MVGGAFLLAIALAVVLNTLLFPAIPRVIGLPVTVVMVLVGVLLVRYGSRGREAEMARQGFRPGESRNEPRKN